LYRKIEYVFKYSTNSKEKGLFDLYLSEECKIKVDKENAHFVFKRGIPLGQEKELEQIKNWVVFDDQVLHENDLKDISHFPEEKNRTFLINQKLKRGSRHIIKLSTKYPLVMSDLIDKSRENDYITFEFFNLTFVAYFSFLFPLKFDISKYEFQVRLRNLAHTLYQPIKPYFKIIKLDGKKYHRISFNLENRDNGDTIIIKYWLKDELYNVLSKNKMKSITIKDE